MEPLTNLADIDWMNFALAVAALAVGWTILRLVLRLTMKVFACGCGVLLAVVGAMLAWVYLG